MIPIVLVHGFMGGSAQWELQRHVLEQVCNVVTVDLPGFGKNNKAETIDNIQGLADWVITDVTSRGVTRFHLLGHSMGGMIAQQIARQVPNRVEKLALYSTGSIGILPGRFETIEQSKQRALEDGVPATARRIAATWFLHGEAAQEYENCAQIAQQTATTAFGAGLDAMQSWTGSEALQSINADTLVLWGDQDRTYPWAQIEQLWSKIPKASLAVIPGCAHAVHLEKPDIFNQHLLDFLSDT